MLLIGGENLMDLIAQPSEARNDLLRAVEGGSPYNTALAAGRQGAKVGYLTPLSQDHFGQRLSARLQRDGVQQLSESVDAPTSLAIVHVVEGQASYQFYRDHTAERQVQLDHLETHLTHGTALHIGSLALTSETDGEVWATLFTKAYERGLFTSVDLNIRPHFIEDHVSYRERLSTVMKAAKLIKLSDEDLSWWVGRPLEDPNELRQASLAIGRTYRPQILLLTRGSRGATALFEHHQKVIVMDRPAATLDHLQDTVGAGDTFMGAFLAQMTTERIQEALFDGWSHEFIGETLTLAMTAAALCCEREGCDPPSRSEVDSRLTRSN